MEYFKQMDWSLVWSIIKDIIIPYSGTLIFNTILFLFIGLILSIIYSIILSKKRVFKRRPKYYNWSVKLYIPMLIGMFLYVFGQIGFLRGVYKILNKEKESIVTSVYVKTLSLTFESEENKNAFIKEIQISAKDVKDSSSYLMKRLKKTTQNYNSGISIVDESKNKISIYLIEKYGNDIYKTGVYGMLNLAGAKAHININESMPYSEFSTAMDFLLSVEHRDIELAIKDKLIIWFTSLLDYQYHSMKKSFFILLLIIMSIPVIEFFIYKKWIEPNLIKKALKK